MKTEAKVYIVTDPSELATDGSMTLAILRPRRPFSLGSMSETYAPGPENVLLVYESPPPDLIVDTIRFVTANDYGTRVALDLPLGWSMVKLSFSELAEPYRFHTPT